MNIVSIEKDSDVVEVLNEALQQADKLSGVIVLGLYKDASQFMRTSTMNAMEKSFLNAFLNAWMVKWFQLEDQ